MTKKSQRVKQSFTKLHFQVLGYTTNSTLTQYNPITPTLFGKYKQNPVTSSHIIQTPNQSHYPQQEITNPHSSINTTTMASSTFFTCTSLIAPIKPLQTTPSSHSTVCLAHLKKSTPLNLSSSHSISVFSPLVPNRAPIVSSPNGKPQSLTIVAAKGYKMKTHKASAKRFRVTGTGKIVRRRAGKQHLLRKKNAKRRNRLSKTVQVDRSDYNNVIGALPYLKVNRAN
ncbi:putative ribosomal protein L35 [Helianthus annuus]|nr:putative ribosomal protein L35 [Helianthus annuus]